MRIARRLQDSILIIAALVCITTSVFAVVNKVSLLTVTTRSMEPTINAGDIVITKATSVNEIQQSDVVVLPLPQNPAIRYTHRVFQVSNLDGEILIKTKGDANPIPDAWTMKINSTEIPTEIAVLPTSRIFNGPINRSSILLLLVTAGFALTLIGLLRLLKRRVRESM